jgi:hypothetical protein
VEISDSVIVICSYDLCNWSINLFTNPNSVYIHTYHVTISILIQVFHLHLDIPNGRFPKVFPAIIQYILHPSMFKPATLNCSSLSTQRIYRILVFFFCINSHFRENAHHVPVLTDMAGSLGIQRWFSQMQYAHDRKGYH